MTYYYSGTITANKPFLMDAIDIINHIAGEELCLLEEYSRANEFFIDGQARDIDLELEKLVRKLADLGYSLEGEISYSGDYDGYYVIHGDKVLTYDKEEIWREHVSDNDLIVELRNRGYIVTGVMGTNKKVTRACNLNRE